MPTLSYFADSLLFIHLRYFLRLLPDVFVIQWQAMFSSVVIAVGDLTVKYFEQPFRLFFPDH